jgi:hypothetical protein
MTANCEPASSANGCRPRRAFWPSRTLVHEHVSRLLPKLWSLDGHGQHAELTDAGGLAMLVRLVPVAILGGAGVGGAVGLIADLRVLLDVCQSIAAAAVPLVQVILWPEFAFASQRDERDEQTRISSTVQGGGNRRLFIRATARRARLFAKRKRTLATG